MQKRQTNQFYAKEIINRMTKHTSQVHVRINFLKTSTRIIDLVKLTTSSLTPLILTVFFLFEATVLRLGGLTIRVPISYPAGNV